MVLLEEFIKLRTEQTRELTHLELDRNLQYVANPWSPDRRYLKGMVIYYSDSSTQSGSGISGLSWFRSNVDHGPSAIFDPADWDPIGESSVSGQVTVKDSAGVFSTVGTIEFDSDFGIQFNGTTALISVNAGAFSVWQENSLVSSTIYYEDNVLIGTDTIIDASYKLTVVGNAAITGNIDVSGLISGVDLPVLYSDYTAHNHTISPTNIVNYTSLFPDSKGQLADIQISSLLDGEFLAWNDSIKRWVNTSATVTAHGIGDHTDVSSGASTNALDNQILLYDGANSTWVNHTVVTDNDTGFSGQPFSHHHNDRYWTKNDLSAATGSIINWDNIFNAPGFTPSDAEYLVVSLSGNLINERVLATDSSINVVDNGANGNYTLSVVDNTTVQKVEVQDNDSPVGTRKSLNFVTPTSGNIQYTITDDAVNDKIDISIELDSAFSLNLNDILDVDASTPVDGNILAYNATSGNWESTVSAAAPVDSVNGLTGVVNLEVADLADTAINPGNFPGPSTGAPFTPDSNILVYDDDISKWVNIPSSQLIASISNIYLDDILDVEVTTFIDDKHLLYFDLNSELWVNGEANDANIYTIDQLVTAGTSSIHWDNITDVPAFAPNSHTHYMHELIDVDDYSSSLPTGGDVLQWNSGTQVWESSAIVTGGFSPVIGNASNAGTYTAAFDQSLVVSSSNSLKIQAGLGIEIETDTTDNIIKLQSSVDNSTIGYNTAGELELIGMLAPAVDDITITYNTAGELTAIDTVNPIKHFISEETSIDEGEMYFIWGDLELDTNIDLNNNGRLVVVNGNFTNNGTYNQGIDGSLELISTNLSYILSEGDITFGQHMYWTDATGTWSAGDSSTSIDLQTDNVYVTKEWVQTEISSNVPPTIWSTNTNGIHYNSGNVGIGLNTASVNTKLEINYSGAAGNAFRIKNTDNNSQFNLSTKLVSSKHLFQINSDNTGLTPLVISDDNRVGIGSGLQIITPQATLHVYSTSNNQPIVLVEDESNPDTTPFIINSAGNVGIGTDTPDSVLDVEGGNGQLEVRLDNEYTSNINQVLLTSTDGSYANMFSVGSDTVSSEFQFGIIGSTATALSQAGSVNDSFILSTSESDDLNIINNAGTGTTDNIAFYAGKDFADDLSVTTPDLIILGDGTNRGYVGLGTSTPTAPLNIEGSTLGQTVFKVDGTLGELFTVKDNLTGVLFSVNNVSGIPILEVEDTNEVRMGSHQAPASYTSTETTITAAGATPLHTIDSTAYDMAVFEYIVKDGSNLRAGTVQAVWTGTTAEFNETATNDIGNTDDVVFSVDASTPGSAKFTATTTTTGWTIKTIVRTI
tara:strand:+ start:4438 stop:8400 length:3963 start_codon:yes stop_codon:yes gene_type:complete